MFEPIAETTDWCDCTFISVSYSQPGRVNRATVVRPEMISSISSVRSRRRSNLASSGSRAVGDLSTGVSLMRASSNGRHGGEVEALEPVGDLTETGRLQTRVMGPPSLGDQDVFERLTLTRDFQIRITLGTLEIMMMGIEPLLFGGRISQLFSQKPDPAGPQARCDLLQQCPAPVAFDELKSEIHQHHGRIVDGQIAGVGFENLDGHAGIVGSNDLATAMDHIGRGVGRDDFHALNAHRAARRQRGCTQGAAQIVDARVRLHGASHHQRGHLQQQAVTGHGPLDHVREDADDRFGELEGGSRVVRVLFGLGVDAIAFAHRRLRQARRSIAGTRRRLRPISDSGALTELVHTTRATPACRSSSRDRSPNRPCTATTTGAAKPASSRWRVASATVPPEEMMSSTSTGVCPSSSLKSGTSSLTSRSPKRVLVMTRQGRPAGLATARAHCSLSPSGPITTGRSTEAAIHSLNAGAAATTSESSV